jgi:hypothetical protein
MQVVTVVVDPRVVVVVVVASQLPQLSVRWSF